MNVALVFAAVAIPSVVAAPAAIAERACVATGFSGGVYFDSSLHVSADIYGSVNQTITATIVVSLRESTSLQKLILLCRTKQPASHTLAPISPLITLPGVLSIATGTMIRHMALDSVQSGSMVQTLCHLLLPLRMEEPISPSQLSDSSHLV